MNHSPATHCFYCGDPFRSRPIAMRRSMDHLVPISRGGSDDPSNLVWAHCKCNSDKGSLTLEEYRIIISFRLGALQHKTFWVFPGERKQ